MSFLYGDADAGRLGAVQSAQGSYRSEWRRDYSRVIHSAAFRRLQGKTQLFPGDESDFFRNRLTHSLEVAQIAKSIALKLNQEVAFFKDHPIEVDIVELAGLCHDLGHPPFGHNGEHALHDCMRKYGGFEGNAQTLRILTRLEKKEAGSYPVGITEDGDDQRLGLNLTYRSLAAILKYDNTIPSKCDDPNPIKGYYEIDAYIVDAIKGNVAPDAGGKFKVIECQIMDVADDIAYSTYDLEDSFKAGFLSPIDILASNDGLLEKVASKVQEKLGSTFVSTDVRGEFLGLFLVH